MSKENYDPYNSNERQERDLWRNKVAQRDLKIVPCVSAWFDICGFGNALQTANWDLNSLRDQGMFEILARAYSRLAYPFIPGVPPMPTERILVINDGIARTADLHGPDYAPPTTILFYLRDLLIAHFHLENTLVASGFGLRTVLAGGERCQYSPTSVTGKSVLIHGPEISEFGQNLLQQQFVYNPLEFQMNTAFAMAYTIESLGTKQGIRPNRLYIAGTWIEKISTVLPEPPEIRDDSIEFPWRGKPGISIAFDDKLMISTKGFSTDVFRVSGFTVHTGFEGEETIFPMSEHDLPG